MGKKGDRAAKEGIAKDLYAQGKTLDEIGTLLDISVTSLSKWKADTKAPSAEYDEWELARQRHRDFIEELRDLFREQLEHIRGIDPSERTSQDYDALSKAAAIVRKWDDIEKAEAAKQMETAASADLDMPTIFLSHLEWIGHKLREIDPEGLKILNNNFDAIILQYKTDHAAGKV